MGKILPLLNTVIGFGLYCLALVLLLTRFFEFPLNKNFLLPFISVALLPYVIDIIYFQFIVLSQLSWTLVITLALITAKRASENHFFSIYTALSTLLLFLSVGGYPASINLYATATVLYLLKQYSNCSNITKLLKQSIPFAVSLIISLALLYITYKWLMAHKMMLHLYNNETAGIMDLFLKIFPTIKLSLISLYQPQPFFNLTYKIISSSIILYSFIILCIKSKPKERPLIFVFFLIILLAVKFSAWLTNETPENYFSQYDPAAFMVRADFYAVPILILFALATLFTSKTIHKNIAFLLSLLLVLSNINADLSFSKASVLGFKSEALLQERINNRLQSSPAYNRYKLYTIVQAGELPMRRHFYQPGIKEKYGYYTLDVPFTRHWIAFEYYNFFAPFTFVREGTAINPEDFSTQMTNFLSQEIQTWPSPYSTYVDDNYGIIALTPKGKSMLTEQFRQLGTH